MDTEQCRRPMLTFPIEGSPDEEIDEILDQKMEHMLNCDPCFGTFRVVFNSLKNMTVH